MAHFLDDKPFTAQNSISHHPFGTVCGWLVPPERHLTQSEGARETSAW